MPKLVMNKTTKAERRAERCKVGSLQSQIVTKNTADRYAQSFHSFLNFTGKTRKDLENFSFHRLTAGYQSMWSFFGKMVNLKATQIMLWLVFGTMSLKPVGG